MNPRLFRTLIDLHHVEVFRVAAHLAPSPEHALELTCSAFAALRLADTAPHFPRSARSTRLDLLARLCGELLACPQTPRPLSAFPGLPLEFLPRACLVLHHLEALSSEEIGELLLLPPGEVARHLGEAKGLAREHPAAASPADTLSTA